MGILGSSLSVPPISGLPNPAVPVFFGISLNIRPNCREKKWGEKYAQAIEETGLEYQTLADAVYVSKKVDFSLRNENLPFGHHREVASLEPDKQTEVLDWAEEEHATVMRKI